MKRIAIAFCLLLFLALPLHAQEYDYCAGAGGAAVCSNNASTDYVGDKSTYVANNQVGSSEMKCMAYQATNLTCSTGTLAYPYLSKYGEPDESAKIFVYVNSHGSDTAPADATNNTLVAASGVVTCTTDSSGAVNCTNSTDVTGTITKNSWYYVCVVGAGAGFYTYYKSSSGAHTSYVQTVADSYASPPATLPASGWTSTAARDRGAYVAIE